MIGIISLVNNYTNGLLSSITRGGYITSGGSKVTQNYNFAYDGFGNTTSVSVGTDASSRTLSTYDYGTGNRLLNKLTYCNGNTVNFTYDYLDRITSELYNGGKGFNYIYTGDGQLLQVRSLDGTDSSVYSCDNIGRLIRLDQKNSATGITQNFRQSYDLSNRPLGFGYIINFNSGATPINKYELNSYNTDGTLATKTTGSGDIISYTYDYLKRVSLKNCRQYFQDKLCLFRQFNS
jgi:YD repeat-containing protein